MEFNPGFDIYPTTKPFGFVYGKGVFGPSVEIRHLDAIRPSLLDPLCDGPEQVYSIAMDVGKECHLDALKQRHLLFGVVTYAAGRLGQEPVRSQGHIHKPSPISGWSTPEIYEIWDGEAVIYMQQYAADQPGRCYAVAAKPGDVVVVPPYWAHATISANPDKPLTFGAWCDRNYGFEYEGVRAHKGLAWYPILDRNGVICWQANPHYQTSSLVCKKPECYSDNLGIESRTPIYTQFENDFDKFLFVPNPALKEKQWEHFIP